MIITDNTMFVIPSLYDLYSGIPAYLDMDSRQITTLLENGYDREIICNAFRELFSIITIEILAVKIPQERKWWQFYKCKYKVEYQCKNLDFKLRVLNYINTGERLSNEDQERIKLYYYSLSQDTRKIIHPSIWGIK